MRDAGLFEQKRGNRLMNDLQYQCEQFAMDGEQTSQSGRALCFVNQASVLD